MRSGCPARHPSTRLQELADQLRRSGSDYWAQQVSILRLETVAWTRQAQKQPVAALETMREAADREDAVEKLPVTPGPIIPAREQLGYLLLDQRRQHLALQEFKTVLVFEPGRRGALLGAELCRRNVLK